MLHGHLTPAGGPSSQASVGAQPCSATAHRQLPRFDTVIMEHYLCDNPALRDEVYDLFRQHPELLVAEEEGLTKGQNPGLPRSTSSTGRFSAAFVH